LILLDTHVLIWLAQDYQRISPKARSAIENARKKGRGLAVAGITFVELARLAKRGQVRFVPDVETHLREFERRFVVLPKRPTSLSRPLNCLPDIPKTPQIASLAQRRSSRTFPRHCRPRDSHITRSADHLVRHLNPLVGSASISQLRQVRALLVFPPESV